MRDTRRLESSLKLEAQAAQLERSTCDKFRVRCVDMEVQECKQMLKSPVFMYGLSSALGLYVCFVWLTCENY